MTRISAPSPEPRRPAAPRRQARHGWRSGLRWLWLAAGAVLLVASGAFAADPAAFQDCPECPEMVRIPAGSFLMGSPADEPDRYTHEGPPHRVAVAAFAAGRYPVTFAQWDACVAAGACTHAARDEGWGRGDRPVIDVSWDDAQAYVAWLGRRTGQRYRLLSEAEYEYAARAGSTSPYPWGERASHDQANYGADSCCEGRAEGRDQWIHTAPVGRFPANAFGLHDMLGNVYEWVQDAWHDSFDGAPTDGSAWAERQDLRRRVLRGGSWGNVPQELRSANRLWFSADGRVSEVGFRVARSLSAAAR